MNKKILFVLASVLAANLFVMATPAMADVVVPDVVGLTIEEAFMEIIYAGLYPQYHYSYHNTVPYGYVISQSVAAGSVVPEHTYVDFEVSSGPCPGVEIPDVVGMSDEEARSAIRAAGFSVSGTYMHSDTVAEGLVFGQNPAAGTMLEEGSNVDLTISMGPPHSPPVQPGEGCLVAHWRLDEMEGGIAYDSASVNDGILMGDPQWSAGVLGGALDFDGDGDYVDCGADEVLNSLSQKMTVATWVNIRSVTTAWMAIVAKGETAWRLSINNETTGIHFGFTGGDRDWQAANSVTELPLEEWHHIAGVYDNEVGATIYVDGVAETVNPDLGGTDRNEMPLLLGENPEEPERFLDGMLDDVRIYGCALSANEIRDLASERAIPIDPGTNGLAASYTFDEDASDSSGNGLDGTFLGDAHVADGVLVLDGDDDTVAIPGIGEGLTEFTFSMMVYPTVDLVPLQFSGGINTDSWGGGVHFKLNYGMANVGVEGYAGGNVVGTSIVEPGKWTHLALTVSPEEVAVYVNGEKEGSRTGVEVPAINIGNASIGSWNNGGTDVQREMTGMMDDVLIYNRALSAGEIRYLAGFRDYKNILANGGFEDGVFEPWLAYGNANTEVVNVLAGAAVPEGPIEGDYCLHVVVPTAAANSWDTSLQHRGHVFEASKKYTLSAFLKCKEGTLQVKLNAELGQSPYTKYGAQTVTMTEE